MSNLAHDPSPLGTGRPIGQGYDRIATAHLLESDFLASVETILDRVGVLSFMACARLSSESMSIESRLWAMADSASSRIIRQEAANGIAGLEAISNASLEKIHILAVGLSLKLQEMAGLTVETLRGSPGAETGMAVNVVLDAADLSSQTLRRIWLAACRDIQAARRNACGRIEAIVRPSEVQRLEASMRCD